MPSPTWLAATPDSPGLAGQINQLLTTHAVSFVYAGVKQSSQTTVGSGSTASNGLFVAQAFTTTSAQATVGYVILNLAATGTPPVLNLTLQAGSGGFPSGTALAAAQVAPDGLSGPAVPVIILLPCSGLAVSTQYWVVTEAAGDATDYFSLAHSSQTSGAATSPDGVTWTAQGYGLLYDIYDGTPAGELIGVSEDGGARQAVLGYTSGLLTSVSEVTAGQAGGYASSSRALSYASSGPLTGIA